jgi:predicted nucleotidyltransferase
MFFSGRERMGELLNQRRSSTDQRILSLQEALKEAETLCGDLACVYAIGSYGRGEAGKHSDLDLFMAGGGTKEKRALSRLTEIRIKADLIEVTEKQGYPPFSGDGEYLEHYTIGELTNSLGTPEDDATNTFTARLLWLLGRSILGKSVYQKLTDDVIGAYWGDYEKYKNSFKPAFLVNDILRMWRTFCVNYEARTSREPAEKNAKRKIKNYKLKHSRLMTCYSGLLYLLAVYKMNETVTPVDAKTMVTLSPTQRIEWLATQEAFANAHEKLRELMVCYEKFLQKTDISETDLISIFLDKTKRTEYLKDDEFFGDLMSDVLQLVGENNSLYRLLIV